MVRLYPLAFLLAVLAAPRFAAAAPSSRLVYGRGPGAEECGDEAALRRAVAARVGYDPFFPWAPLTVTVEVTTDGGHLRARVVVVDERGIEKGAQTLAGTGASCDDLLESIALAVSVALDAAPRTTPKADTPQAPPEPPPAAPPAPEVAPVSPVLPAAIPRDTASSSRERREPSLRAPSLWVAPGARASDGMWKVPSFGPDLLVELRFGRLGLGAEGRYDLATVSVGGSAQASVQRATGSVLPCAHFGWLAACGLATFGDVWARGDLAAPLTASAPYVALGGRVAADVPLLPKLHLLGTVDVVGIATSTVIAVDAGAETTTSQRLEASGGLALFVPIL